MFGKTLKRLAAAAVSCMLTNLCAAGSADTLKLEHVVVIGCDGMSPDGIRKAEAPVMKRMMSQGAYTLRARGVMPTSSSPNWASMIMGAGPEQHGVTSNDWETNKFEIEPAARGTGPMFPTIFGQLRQQQPAAKMPVFMIGVGSDAFSSGRLRTRSRIAKGQRMPSCTRSNI